VSIAQLGDIYVGQTGDHSLCTITSHGKRYCPCVFECGNGIWSCDQELDGGLVFETGCKKYCHAGICDG
ncbi:hypothetical protein T440DRAFT_401232, partial [Plenodomus tracheiphilus IPT5]